MIKIWNAFASNNSGSYVIVGSFPNEALAGEVAAELLELARAQSAWIENTEGDSPVHVLADKLGTAREDDFDTWPAYSGNPHPEVFAIGHQVFVHSDYTVTMPRVLGHAIYARGGRVQTEVNHAHHAIIATFECWFPWEGRQQIDIPARVQDIVDTLCAGAFTLPQHAEHPAAWHAGGGGFGESDLVVGAAFDDLAAGFKAVQAAVSAQGAKVKVSVAEAAGDPLAYLRPCAPPTR